MSDNEFRVYVCTGATTMHRLMASIESTDVIIVIDDSRSPTRMITGSSLSGIDPGNQMTIDEWFAKHGGPLARKVLSQEGQIDQTVRFNAGTVSRVAGQFVLRDLKFSGPYDEILPGTKDIVPQKLFCDDYYHMNLVNNYEPGMLCNNKEEDAHPIRNED